MGHSDSDESDLPSPAELRIWLQQELKDCSKALELRSKEATEIVKAYEKGALSAEQACERIGKYHDRWGEALFGTTSGVNAIDEEIIEAIDRAREKQSARLRGAIPSTRQR